MRNKKTYLIDNITVDIYYKYFQKNNSNNVNVFLPGWNTTEESKVVLELCSNFALVSNFTTIAIYAEIIGTNTNETYLETQAIAKFIQEEKLNNINIIGYSQGGTRTLYLSHLLNSVENLILIAPTSLYKTSKFLFLFEFFFECLVLILIHSINESFKVKNLSPLYTYFEVGSDVLSNIIRQVWINKFNVITKFYNQVVEMTRPVSNIKEIKVPVILIQGMEDMISSTKKIFSKKIRRKILRYIASSPDQLVWVPEEESFLHETLFHNSEKVTFLSTKKASHHLIPIFHPNYVAKVTFNTLYKK